MRNAAMASGKITKKTVDALRPGPRDVLLWDNELKGFGARVRPNGTRFYVVKYRHKGRQRWVTIGRHGSPWAPEGARKRAKAILGDVADGEDPAIFRDQTKRDPTLADLAERFLVEHVEAKLKPSTAKGYRDFLERLTIPALGRLRVADVTHGDVARLHHALRATPYQANRVLAVLSKLFSWAEHHGYRADGSNPCRRIEKYRERKVERFLSEDELARLGKTLSNAEQAASENPYVVAAIRLLIFTGARIGEILGLRWEHVEFERAMLRIADSKTGAKVIYLSAPALDVLANLPRQEGNSHVICGTREGGRFVDLEKPWRRIRSQAKLEDVRLHDLRHSFASVGVSGGASLPVIGKLLGHTQPATTARYAHLSADPLRAANEAIGQSMAAALSGRSGTIVPFASGRSRRTE